MNEHTGQVRMHDLTKNPQFDHSPESVIWRCPKRHRLLRVFRIRTGWHLLGDEFEVRVPEYLDRIGTEYTVDDIREGRVHALDARHVKGQDRMLPLDIATWPAVRLEVGCRCAATYVSLGVLAEDCRRAQVEHPPITRTIG
ncbi:MAG: hypothetical protein ACXV7I_15910 [Ilumatobacteraceae bacterium]